MRMLNLIPISIILVGCQNPVASHPKELVYHWLNKEDPKLSGLILRLDGRGERAGKNLALAGNPFFWRVEGKSLILEQIGEEGERGLTSTYLYVLEGKTLVLTYIKNTGNVSIEYYRE